MPVRVTGAYQRVAKVLPPEESGCGPRGRSGSSAHLAARPLWKLPEFQRRMADEEEEMAGQLANLREMERNGKLAPIPPDGRSSQHGLRPR